MKWADLSSLSEEPLAINTRRKKQNKTVAERIHSIFRNSTFLFPSTGSAHNSPHWLSMLSIKLKDLVQSSPISENSQTPETIPAKDSLCQHTSRFKSTPLRWWCALIGRFLQKGGPRTGSRHDGRTRTAHLSGSYLPCTDRQRHND